MFDYLISAYLRARRRPKGLLFKNLDPILAQALQRSAAVAFDRGRDNPVAHCATVTTAFAPLLSTNADKRLACSRELRNPHPGGTGRRHEQELAGRREDEAKSSDDLGLCRSRSRLVEQQVTQTKCDCCAIPLQDLVWSLGRPKRRKVGDMQAG
jgi:hypothetical protein